MKRIKMRLIKYLSIAIAGVLLLTGCADSDGGDETIAPTVVLTSPATDETEVATNRKVNATFSEDMSPLTMNTTTFSLAQGGTSVSGTVTYVGKIATFTPDINFDASTLIFRYHYHRGQGPHQ